MFKFTFTTTSHLPSTFTQALDLKRNQRVECYSESLGCEEGSGKSEGTVLPEKEKSDSFVKGRKMGRDKEWIRVKDEKTNVNK